MSILRLLAGGYDDSYPMESDNYGKLPDFGSRLRCAVCGYTVNDAAEFKVAAASVREIYIPYLMCPMPPIYDVACASRTCPECGYKWKEKRV